MGALGLPARGHAELQGQGAAEGVAIGRAVVFPADDPPVPRRHIASHEIETEIGRFRRSLKATRADLVAARELLSERVDDDHGSIMDAQLMVLDDPMLLRQVDEGIRKERLNAEAALSDAVTRVGELFSGFHDEYLRERGGDVSDVSRRLLRHLSGKGSATKVRISEGAIVVARTSDPWETAMYSREGAAAMVLELSGRTSHTAILARSLGLPTVVGVVEATQTIRTGDELVVDGGAGLVVARPEPGLREHYRREQKRAQERTRMLQRLKNLPAQTLDGFRIEVAANVGLLEELPSVFANGAEGIGLYRTEFLFLNRTTLPDEDEQFDAYRKIAKAVSPYAAIIRTIDLGGDKLPALGTSVPEANPYLGLRGVRLCLAKPEFFHTQLRALLRASAFAKIKILFPMISGVFELRAVKAELAKAQAELREEGVAFDREIEVGAMIEIPSAALTADRLAREVDFFSIGTNDLIQYTMAADRGNERVNHLLDPLQPAILRLIRDIVNQGHKEGTWVGVCGEMASDPLYTLLLAGLGLDELSMVPTAAPAVKQIIREVRMSDARRLAERLLLLDSPDEAREELRMALSSLRGIRVRR